MHRLRFGSRFVKTVDSKSQRLMRCKLLNSISFYLCPDFFVVDCSFEDTRRGSAIRNVLPNHIPAFVSDVSTDLSIKFVKNLMLSMMYGFSKSVYRSHLQNFDDLTTMSFLTKDMFMSIFHDTRIYLVDWKNIA